MITYKKIVLIVTVLVLTAGVYAQDAAAVNGEVAGTVLPDETTLTVDTDTAGTAGPDLNNNVSTFSAWDILRMVLVLGAVLGVIYLLFYLLKKASRPVKDSGSIIDLIATRSLTNNSAVHLIKVGNQVFLLGAGDSGIRLVSEITDKETLDQISLENSSSGAGTKSFAEVLKGVFSGGNSSSDGEIQGNSFFKKQKDRLRNLK